MPFTEHAEELLEKVREFGLEALIGKRDRDDFGRLRTEMEEITEQLLDVSEMMRRRNPETTTCESTGHFTFDGPRLVKFLALDGNEGVE